MGRIRVLIPVRKVVEQTGTSAPTLSKWRKKGIGPDWCRMSSRILYDWDSVQAFIEQRIEDAKAPRAAA